MSLATPDSIRKLQRKLYLKAKDEPAFRFYLLHDKICREDILRHAYDLARANKGAPGVDGVTFATIEAAGREEWLAAIRKDLVAKTYRPQPVRRVTIPKPGGGERPLGIPTIRDRVVQTAGKLVLEPIFEADLDPAAFGYRPKRSGTDAIKEVHALLCGDDMPRRARRGRRRAAGRGDRRETFSCARLVGELRRFSSWLGRPSLAFVEDPSSVPTGRSADGGLVPDAGDPGDVVRRIAPSPMKSGSGRDALVAKLDSLGREDSRSRDAARRHHQRRRSSSTSCMASRS